MSREIKFRAWWYNARHDHYEMSSKVMCGGMPETCPMIWYENSWGHLTEDTNIMQFTGLHDKNGKEIYEGDLAVFVYNDVRGHSLPYEVKMLMGCWRLVHGNKDTYLYSHLEEIEVLGNRFENPEHMEES